MLGTLPSESVCSYVCAMLGAQRAICLMRLLVPFALACGVIALLVGMVLPTFSVNTFGVVAKLMEFEGENAWEATYSFFELCQLLASIMAKDFVNQFGLWSLTVMFIVSTAVLPVLQALLWSILWAVPLSLRGLKRCLWAVETIAAWQFFDVFLVAVLITVLQIGRFSTGFLEALDDLIGKSQFEMINNVFTMLQSVGFLRETDGTILTLKSDLLIGAYVLLAAAFLLALTGIFVNRRGTAFLQLRQEKSWKLKAMLDDTPHPSKADSRMPKDALSSAYRAAQETVDDGESYASSTAGPSWFGKFAKTLSSIVPSASSNAEEDGSECDVSPRQVAAEP